MNKIINVIDNLNKVIGYVSCIIFIPMMLIVTYEVIMRYVFNSPTIWAWDLNIQLFAFVTMLGGGYTLLYEGHVCVDVLVQKMNIKKRAILNLIISLIILFGVIVLLFGGIKIFILSYKVKETMSTLWAPPIYYMKMMIPVGSFLILLQVISNCLKNIKIIHDKGKRG